MDNNYDLNNRNWKNICIVGLGRHAVNTIIPALNSMNKNIAGFVTSKDKFFGSDFLYFSNILDAMNYFDNNTLFILCNPPSAHYKDAKNLLFNNFDVMVEKPAIIYEEELCELINLAKQKNLVFLEMFMYLESSIVQNTIQNLKKEVYNIKSIKSIFTIPNLPPDTFRDENKIESSLLFDIGCYPLSFLIYCDIELSNISLYYFRENDKLFGINAESGNIKIDLKLGCDSEYQNLLEINFLNQIKTIVKPFYHGKSLKKIFIRYQNSKSFKEEYIEINAFEKMFSHSRSYWIDNQNERFDKMIKIVRYYSLLKNKLNIN